MLGGFFNPGLVEPGKGRFGLGRGRVSLKRKGGRGKCQEEAEPRERLNGSKEQKRTSQEDCSLIVTLEGGGRIFDKCTDAHKQDSELDNTRELLNPHFPSPKRISKSGNAKREVNLQRKKTNYLIKIFWRRELIIQNRSSPICPPI